MFSEALDEYLALRAGAGADRGAISTARLRAEIFAMVRKDKPIDEYLPIDLRLYVNDLQYLPLAYGKTMPESAEVRAIGPSAAIEANRGKIWQAMTRKTMEDGYVQIVKAVFGEAANLHPIRNPFAEVRVKWPESVRPSVQREALDSEKLNEVFRRGVESGFIDDALLPALALTTSRRIGLLAHLRGCDFQTKHGVSIVRVDGVSFNSQTKQWYRIPFKTVESLNFFALHQIWDDVGFSDWARAQGDGFIFRQLHQNKNPADSASKRCSRLLMAAGAIGCNIEVTHALRHGAKDGMVAASISGQTRRKQMGQAIRRDVTAGGFDPRPRAGDDSEGKSARVS